VEKLHCDGCGITEPAKDTQHKIQHVVLGIVEDSRFPGGTKKFEADLCPQCQGTMLYTYFGIGQGGSLEIPAFLEPVRKLTAVSS
jgi:hypothetical protein